MPPTASSSSSSSKENTPVSNTKKQPKFKLFNSIRPSKSTPTLPTLTLTETRTLTSNNEARVPTPPSLNHLDLHTSVRTSLESPDPTDHQEEEKEQEQERLLLSSLHNGASTSRVGDIRRSLALLDETLATMTAMGFPSSQSHSTLDPVFDREEAPVVSSSISNSPSATQFEDERAVSPHNTGTVEEDGEGQGEERHEDEEEDEGERISESSFQIPAAFALPQDLLLGQGIGSHSSALFDFDNDILWTALGLDKDKEELDDTMSVRHLNLSVGGGGGPSSSTSPFSFAPPLPVPTTLPPPSPTTLARTPYAKAHERLASSSSLSSTGSSPAEDQRVSISTLERLSLSGEILFPEYLDGQASGSGESESDDEDSDFEEGDTIVLSGAQAGAHAHTNNTDASLSNSTSTITPPTLSTTDNSLINDDDNDDDEDDHHHLLSASEAVNNINTNEAQSLRMLHFPAPPSLTPPPPPVTPPPHSSTSIKDNTSNPRSTSRSRNSSITTASTTVSEGKKSLPSGSNNRGSISTTRSSTSSSLNVYDDDGTRNSNNSRRKSTFLSLGFHDGTSDGAKDNQRDQETLSSLVGLGMIQHQENTNNPLLPRPAPRPSSRSSSLASPSANVRSSTLFHSAPAPDITPAAGTRLAVGDTLLPSHHLLHQSHPSPSSNLSHPTPVIRKQRSLPAIFRRASAVPDPAVFNHFMAAPGEPIPFPVPGPPPAAASAMMMKKPALDKLVTGGSLGGSSSQTSSFSLGDGSPVRHAQQSHQQSSSNSPTPSVPSPASSHLSRGATNGDGLPGSRSHSPVPSATGRSPIEFYGASLGLLSLNDNEVIPVWNPSMEDVRRSPRAKSAEGGQKAKNMIHRKPAPDASSPASPSSHSPSLPSPSSLTKAKSSDRINVPAAGVAKPIASSPLATSPSTIALGGGGQSKFLKSSTSKSALREGTSSPIVPPIPGPDAAEDASTKSKRRRSLSFPSLRRRKSEPALPVGLTVPDPSTLPPPSPTLPQAIAGPPLVPLPSPRASFFAQAPGSPGLSSSPNLSVGGQSPALSTKSAPPEHTNSISTPPTPSPTPTQNQNQQQPKTLPKRKSRLSLFIPKFGSKKDKMERGIENIPVPGGGGAVADSPTHSASAPSKGKTSGGPSPKTPSFPPPSSSNAMIPMPPSAEVLNKHPLPALVIRRDEVKVVGEAQDTPRSKENLIPFPSSTAPVESDSSVRSPSPAPAISIANDADEEQIVSISQFVSRPARSSSIFPQTKVLETVSVGSDSLLKIEKDHHPLSPESGLGLGLGLKISPGALGSRPTSLLSNISNNDLIVFPVIPGATETSLISRSSSFVSASAGGSELDDAANSPPSPALVVPEVSSQFKLDEPQGEEEGEEEEHDEEEEEEEEEDEEEEDEKSDDSDDVPLGTRPGALTMQKSLRQKARSKQQERTATQGTESRTKKRLAKLAQQSQPSSPTLPSPPAATTVSATTLDRAPSHHQAPSRPLPAEPKSEKTLSPTPSLVGHSLLPHTDDAVSRHGAGAPTPPLDPSIAQSTLTLDSGASSPPTSRSATLPPIRTNSNTITNTAANSAQLGAMRPSVGIRTNSMPNFEPGPKSPLLAPPRPGPSPIAQQPLQQRSGAPPPTVQRQSSVSSRSAEHRIFVNTHQVNFLATVTPQTRVGEVIGMARAQGLLNGGRDEEGGWALFEIFRSMGLERPVREYELLDDVFRSWNGEANILIIRRTPLYSVLGAQSRLPSRNQADFVQLEGKKGKWSKRYLAIKDGALVHSKSEKGKDATPVCQLSSFEAFILAPHMIDQVKPPKPFVFALKSILPRAHYENAEEYCHYISVKSQEEADQWVEAITATKNVHSRQRDHAARAASNKHITGTPLMSTAPVPPALAPPTNDPSSWPSSAPRSVPMRPAPPSLSKNPSMSQGVRSSSQMGGSGVLASRPPAHEWQAMNDTDRQRWLKEAERDARANKSSFLAFGR